VPEVHLEEGPDGVDPEEAQGLDEILDLALGERDRVGQEAVRRLLGLGEPFGQLREIQIRILQHVEHPLQADGIADRRQVADLEIQDVLQDQGHDALHPAGLRSVTRSDAPEYLTIPAGRRRHVIRKRGREDDHIRQDRITTRSDGHEEREPSFPSDSCQETLPCPPVDSPRWPSRRR